METKVTLTKEQAEIAQKCMDAAIRQGGANAAVVILPVMQAVEAQLQSQSVTLPESTD